jgi:hypothetical protein
MLMDLSIVIVLIGKNRHFGAYNRSHQLPGTPMSFSAICNAVVTGS